MSTKSRLFKSTTIAVLIGLSVGCSGLSKESQETIWSSDNGGGSVAYNRPSGGGSGTGYGKPDYSTGDSSAGESDTASGRTAAGYASDRPARDDSGSGISTTGMAAATGAAVGGGLGLVIGATSGNAGEGLALGALAGSAAGAGIGYKIQGQEKRLAAQREKVAAQDQMITQQGRELSELRERAQDRGERMPVSGYNQTSDRGRMSSLSAGDRTFNRSRYEQISVSELNRPAPPTQAARPTQVASAGTRAARTAPQAGSMESNYGTPPVTTIASPAGSSRVQMPTKPMLPSSSVEEQDLTASTDSYANRAMPVQAETAPMQMAKSTMPEVKPAAALPAANMLPPARSNPVEDETNFSDETGAVVDEDQAEVEEAAPEAVEKLSAKSSGMPAAKTDAKSETKAISKAVAKSAGSAGAVTAAKPEPVKTEIPKAEIAAKAEPVKPAQLAKVEIPSSLETPKKKGDALSDELARAIPQNANCSDAEQEATRARKSNSDADKLFYFRRAIRLCPEQPDYYVEIGKVYVNIGRTQDAQSEFNKALELDPENERAQEELNMIMLGATY